MKKNSVMIVSALLLSLSLSDAAQAQCENPAVATSVTQRGLSDQAGQINRYARQELNFLDAKLKDTATSEVMTRYDEFRRNIFAALNRYADRVMSDLRDQSKQRSLAVADKTRQIGTMADARLQGEVARSIQMIGADLQRETVPAASACVMDSLGAAQTKGDELAKAVARGVATDSSAVIANREGTPGASGTAATIAHMYQDIKTKYCDPARGDPWCAAPAPMAGRNIDLPALLWGERQTIDLDSEENRQTVETVIRNIAGPLPENTITQAAAGGDASAVEETLRRRAHLARMNTIYNALGQMVGQRVGGTGGNSQEIRLGAGAHPEDAAIDASYRELQEALARDRFTDPEYLFRMANYPASIVRELGTVQAQRLTQLSDLYRRFEDLVWMEGALLGAILDESGGRNRQDAR